MLRNRFAQYLLTAFVLILCSGLEGVQAQKTEKEELEFKGSPAKIMGIADELYKQRMYKDAVDAYQAVLEKDPSNYKATFRLGKCYKIIQNYDDAIKWFEMAVNLDANANDTVYFELGTSYKMMERYNDALEMFQNFKRRYTVKDEYKKRADLEIESCQWAPGELEKKPAYSVKPVNFNGPSGDMFPSMFNQSGQDSFMVFTSARSESQGNSAYSGLGEVAFSDLWMVKMEDDSTFGVVENIGKRVNTKLNDGSSTFSPDFMSMIFSICGQGKMGYGCSIYESKFDPELKEWEKPEMLEGINGDQEVVVNTRGKTKKVPTWDAQPNLSRDGNTMYFVSNREGGWGKLDIWFSTREGDKWSDPVNAGPKINTAFDDLSPFLNDQNDILYFASAGRIGFGGLDMYMSEGTTGNWGDPINIGVPVNSSWDDFGGIWTGEDSLAYFTSNRKGGEGRDDIYWARKIPEPALTVAVHGVVRDKKTFQPVPFATVILFRVGDQEVLFPIDTFKTDQSASYNFPLEPGFLYKVLANAPEYLANEMDFNTEGINKDTDLEVNVDIELERIDINRPIILNDIYYDYDKADLREASIGELNRLVELLRQNPNISIQIGSHTDSNGSENYNKRLSERRARSVVGYLVEQTVAADRLTWYGFGESTLMIYPEMSDDDEQINRRSEFRINSIEYEPAE